MEIPEPHNFMLRKLELILGASYGMLCGLLIYQTSRIFVERFKEEEIHERQIFLHSAIITFVFYLFISVWFNHANPPTGDEPSYLLVAHSIANDRDIDLRNNYDNGDHKKFYKGDFYSHEIEVKGRLLSYHPVLFPCLSVPFYAAARRYGVSIFQNILAGIFAGCLALFIYKVFRSKKTAFAGAAIAVFTLPFIVFANHACTEFLNAVLVIAPFLIILYYRKQYVYAAILSAMLPWAHPRNFLFWIVIAAIFAWENRKEIKKILSFAVVQAASLAALFFYNMYFYGVLIPKQGKGELTTMEMFGFNLPAILGNFFDQEFGLLFYTPVFGLAAAGAWIMLKRDKKTVLYLSSFFLPYFILIASWANEIWFGGNGVSSRFLTPVVCVFSVFICELIFFSPRGFAGKILKISVFWSFLMTLSLFVIPWFRWNKGFGENWLLKFMSEGTGVNFSGFFPSLTRASTNDYILAVIGAAVFIVINIYMIKKCRTG